MFVLAEDEALVPKVTRRGESVLWALLVALYQMCAGRDKQRAWRAKGGRRDKQQAERGKETIGRQEVGRAAGGARQGDTRRVERDERQA